MLELWPRNDIITHMHPDIAIRLEKLEDRRKALVERVRSLPTPKQTERPTPGEFSPAEIVMHMALAEKYDVEIFKKQPPETLKGKKLKQTFIFRKVMSDMAGAKKAATLKAMTPEAGVSFSVAEKNSGEVRKNLTDCFEKVPAPDAPMSKNFIFGTLSASDWLGLFEAHFHYHETRFPA